MYSDGKSSRRFFCMEKQRRFNMGGRSLLRLATVIACSDRA